MENLEVKGINERKIEEMFEKLDSVAKTIAEQRRRDEENRKENAEIIAMLEEAMLKLGATPEEIEETKHSTPEKEAERYPKEYLEVMTEEYMNFINIFSEGWVMPFLGKPVKLGLIIEKCKQTQMDFSEIPQDDYKKRYIVSKKTMEYIADLPGMFSDKGAEEKGATGPVKKIGTK